jgi:hypothetical protein
MIKKCHLKILLTVGALLCANRSFSQVILKPNYGIDNLLVGYATRADVFAEFGPGGDTIRNQFLTPYSENDTSKGYVRSSEVFYKHLGIHFIFDRDDSEIVSNLYFVEPFVGKNMKGDVIKPGITVEDLIAKYGVETLKANAGTTGASPYWSVMVDSIEYYFRKDTSGKYLNPGPIWIKTFDESLPFLRKQKVIYVGLPLPFSSRYVLKTFTQNDTTYSIPLYAPDSEHHLNGKVTDGNILNYFKYGEGAWPGLRAGYTRSYHPNHVIASEGNYDDDKEVGIFKYYDETGRLIKTVDYGYSKKTIYVLILVGFLIIYLIFRLRRNASPRPEPR